MKLSHLNNSGYALYLVLAVLSVVFIFSWNVLQLSSMQHTAIARFYKQDMASLAAFSGIERAKANLADDPEWSPVSFVEQTGERAGFSLEVGRYGGYVRAVSRGTYVNLADTMAVLLGQQPSGAFDNAIVLTDAMHGLVVAGKNSINGNVCMTGTEVKASTDPRLRFTGDKPLVGQCTPLDSASVPVFAYKPLLAYMDQCDSMLRLPQNIDRLVKHSLVVRREADFPVGRVIFVEGDLDLQLPPGEELRDKTIYVERRLLITGSGSYDQIRFTVGRNLVVKDSADFRNCLFYASEGGVLGGKRFGSQILARDTVEVRTSCLEFPSFLFLARGEGKGVIRLGPHTESRCAVAAFCAPSAKTGGQLAPAIILDTTASLNGMIWSNNMVTVAGKLDGLVCAKSFCAYRSPTLYVNWLFDSSINRNKLDLSFLLPAVFGKQYRMESYRVM